jgi:rod shape-determining protein MreC
MVESVFGKGWDYLTSLGNIPALITENRALSAEVARLNTERSHWAMVKQENADLRKLLNFNLRPEATWIAAEVLARSRDGWWQTIRLNKGSAHDIAENMAVVSMDGLVGRVVAVSRNTADVLLLSDASSRVSSRLVRSGSFGIVSGRGPSWQGQVFCRMEFIHKNETLQPGDDVVTSGLGGVFPANLPIGYVDRVYTDPSGLFQAADVVTRASLGDLRYVFVLRHEPVGEMP